MEKVNDMKVQLTITPKYLPRGPLVISIPDSEEDIERYLKDFIFDEIVKASFHVVRK